MTSPTDITNKLSSSSKSINSAHEFVNYNTKYKETDIDADTDAKTDTDKDTSADTDADRFRQISKGPPEYYHSVTKTIGIHETEPESHH